MSTSEIKGITDPKERAIQAALAASAYETTYSDSNGKTIGHIRTFEMLNNPSVQLTPYEIRYIAVVNVLLDLFGKHQHKTTYFSLDLWHRQLWGNRAYQILSALGIYETEEIH